MAKLDFDANDVEPSKGFEIIPEAWYKAIIEKSEMKQTKAKTGEFLALTFQIVDGEHKGRQLWTNLNMKNPNETAVRIARADLSAICSAVGVMAPKDSQELHSLPLFIHVKQVVRKDNGEKKNEIKGYKSTADEPVAAVTGDSEAPPWQK